MHVMSSLAIKEAYLELVPAFQKRTGSKVDTEWVGGVDLMKRVKAGETDANWRFSLESGTCLGTCSIGPEIIVNGTHHARMTPAKVESVLEQYP